MSVFIRCDDPPPKTCREEIIACCPPPKPQCLQICTTSCPQEVVCNSCEFSEKPKCPPPMPVTCMPCPPQSLTLPCAPRPFVCPSCTGHPCINCAPLPKPVPAPFECGPVLRTSLITGGLFYIGTSRCYNCPSFVC